MKNLYAIYCLRHPVHGCSKNVINARGAIMHFYYNKKQTVCKNLK